MAPYSVLGLAYLGAFISGNWNLSMTFIITFLVIFFNLYAGAMVYILWRNNEVYIFKRDLLDVVSHLAKRDISRGLPFMWRYDMLNSVRYRDILYSFKPLEPESYWEDLSFLDSNVAVPSWYTKEEVECLVRR